MLKTKQKVLTIVCATPSCDSDAYTAPENGPAFATNLLLMGWQGDGFSWVCPVCVAKERVNASREADRRMCEPVGGIEIKRYSRNHVSLMNEDGWYIKTDKSFSREGAFLAFTTIADAAQVREEWLCEPVEGISIDPVCCHAGKYWVKRNGAWLRDNGEFERATNSLAMVFDTLDTACVKREQIIDAEKAKKRELELQAEDAAMMENWFTNGTPPPDWEELQAINYITDEGITVMKNVLEYYRANSEQKKRETASKLPANT